MDSRVHRSNLNGRPLCGATGRVRRSSGAVVTCPDCAPPLGPVALEGLRSIVERGIADAAQRYRERNGR